MNRGHIIGFFAFLFLNGMGLAAYFANRVIPEYAGLFLAISAVCLYTAGFVLFWGFSLEGNVFYRRVLGGRNAAIDIFIEAGRFANFIDINASADDLKHKGDDYKNQNSKMLFRKGSGIPYQIHVDGNVEPIDISNVQPEMDASVNTAYQETKKARITAMLFNRQYSRIELFAIFAIIAIVLGIVYLNFGPLADINTKLDRVGFIAQTAYNAVVTPSAIPGG